MTDVQENDLKKKLEEEVVKKQEEYKKLARFRFVTIPNAAHHQDYQDQAAHRGGRLPTNEEVVTWLHGKAYGPLAEYDTWVPTLANDGTKDWIQIADSRHGNRHTILGGGYPGWGDSRDANGFKGFLLYVEEKAPPVSIIEVVSAPLDSSWEDYKAFAAKHEGRLPTNSEVKAFLHGEAYAPLRGRDTWVPTVSASGEKDWVEIGDVRFGLSHTATYGYPGWGNTKEANGFKGFVLVAKAHYVAPNIELISVPLGSKWEDLKNQATYRGGRLPTNEEVKKILNGAPYPFVVGRDTWIPTSTNGQKDWIEIGDARFGTSHTESYGYPGWGDTRDANGFKGFIFLVKESAPPPVLPLQLVEAPRASSWNDYKEIAAFQGARLPTNEEVRKFLHGEAYYTLRGRDTWVPTYDANGQRDWIEIGDTRFGTSHTAAYGYPGWGNTTEADGFKGFILIVSSGEGDDGWKQHLREEELNKHRQPLPNIPEVIHFKERLEDANKHPGELPNDVPFGNFHEISSGTIKNLATSSKFQFFETFTANGNVVVSTQTGHGSYLLDIFVQNGKYGKDVIFYWEDYVRKEIHVDILPGQDKRLSAHYEVKDAQNNQLLEKVELVLEKVGGSTVKIQAHHGVVSLPEHLDDGEYVLKFHQEGFSYTEVRGSVYLNCRKDLSQLPLFLSRTLATGERRFVLRWSEPKSKDLDLHILGSDNSHVFYQKKNIEHTADGVTFKVSLDIDVTTGFGPETATLTNLKPGVKYSILIHNFDKATPLSLTGANVTYFGNTTSEVFVPNNGDRTSVWWFVGGLLDNGEFRPFNQLQLGDAVRVVENLITFNTFPWPL